MLTNRFIRAKKSYATRRVPRAGMVTLLTDGAKPRAGDLVLARVDKLGQHKNIETETGRKARLFPGDEIILAYGNRYAPDQFEALVPDSLEACHMVAAGGIAATATCKHLKMSGATEITPLGLIGDAEGLPLNLSRFALEPLTVPAKSQPQVIAVVGTSMNSGKTETATQLIRGLTQAGWKVGAAKVTGTGSGGDIGSMSDAGALPALDFTDAGLATTYLAPMPQIEAALTNLVGHLRAAEVDFIVLEVADGVFQKETAALLGSDVFARTVNGVIFAACDAMGAAAGVKWLRRWRLPVLGVTGLLTNSPLAMREALAVVQLPIVKTRALGSAELPPLLSLPKVRQEPLIQSVT